MLSLCYISIYLQVSAVKASLSGVDQPPAVLSAAAKQNGPNQEVPQMSDPAGWTSSFYSFITVSDSSGRLSSLCLFNVCNLSFQRPEKAGKMEDYNRRRADEDQLISIFLSWGLLCITGKRDSLLWFIQYSFSFLKSQPYQMFSGYSVGSRSWRARKYVLCFFLKSGSYDEVHSSFYCVKFSDRMRRSGEADWSKLQPHVLIVCELKQSSLREDLRVGRWRRRGSGWGWTSGGLCLRRSADTGTSWAWRTTSPSGWKPSPWSPACLRTWPSTSWTSLPILGSRSESCPGCLTTSSRRWA